MISIIIITLIAFAAFLLITGFVVMRDFSRSWIRHSGAVFSRKQGVNYYGELAVTLAVTLIIALAAALLKGTATILVALATTDDIAQFTTALRGTFSSYTTELQNPKNYILLFFLNPALKMLAVYTLISGIKLYCKRINAKVGGDCFNQADVLYFSSLGVLFLVGIELLCHIQDIKMANMAGNIAYLLLDKFSYVLFYLTLADTIMLRSNKSHLDEAMDKYLITNHIEKKITMSCWKMVVLAYVLGLLLSTPCFLGLQFIRSNITLLSVFIIVLGIAILIMKKVFADAWNYLGTVVFASASSEPINVRKPVSNKLRLPIFIGLVLAVVLLVAFGIAYPRQLFMLLLIMAVAVCLAAFSIVVTYFLTMGISYLVASLAKGDTSTSPADKSFAYIGWVLTSLPKSIALSASMVVLAFMAMTCFPKELKCDHIFNNSSVVDPNGNWLYIDEEHDHYYAPVTYDELPEFFKKVLVIQEDRGFFQQGDLLPNGTSNWHGVSLSVFRGRGGSNLNAQLCKNITYIDADGFPRDMSRKLAEMVSGYMISQKESPESIISKYTNIAGFHGGWGGFGGANAAALFAFGKPIDQLNHLQQLYLVNTLPRSVYVKGENAKVAYNDVQNDTEGVVKKALLKKAERWYEDGYLSKKEFNALKREDLNFTNCRYKSAVPISTRLMLEKNFKTHPGRHDCTITLDNEKTLEAAYDLLKTKEAFRKAGAELQVAALVVEAQSGKIVGHFSSSEVLDYANEYTFPIGSIGKPAICLSLLQAGVPANFTLYDGVIDKRKTPHNSHGWSNTYVNLETILSKSLNCPFRNIDALGVNPKTIFADVERAYDSMQVIPDKAQCQEDIYNYPLGIREMRVCDVAQIYQTIFNNGIYVPLSLEQKSDNVKSKKIWDNTNASVVKNALNKTIENKGGTLHKYKNALPDGKTYYGKTGTSSRQRDGWTVLSDGNIVIVCWASYGKQVGDKMDLVQSPLWGANTAGLFAELVYNELEKTHNF